MKTLTPSEAWELLNEYNKGEFHLKHGRIVGDVMRWYAEKLGYGDEADFWETVGILHDLDFEMYPEEHCIKEQEIMRERGADMLGWTLDDLITQTIEAMKTFRP